MTEYRLWMVVLSLLILAGCGQGSFDSSRPAPVAALAQTASADRGRETGKARAGEADHPGAATPTTGLNRKIIYSAHVEIVVENFDGIPDRIAALVKKFDGYVADSNLAGASGANRHATWKIRVPIARFDQFVDAAKELGELASASTQSQDVSEEYYDVDARIRNKTREEERLLQLLEERPGKLADVIAIEHELSRVREELERMQGRLRVLADLTAMTTVQLSINEIQNYEPPQTPTFATRVRRAFLGSIEGLQSTGENAVVAAAALGPWLGLVGLCAVPGYGVLRRLRRKQHATSDTAESKA